MSTSCKYNATITLTNCCSIGSDEDDGGDGDEEASLDDPSETAVSRDAANQLCSSSTSSSSLSPTPLDHSPNILTEVTYTHISCLAVVTYIYHYISTIALSLLAHTSCIDAGVG